MLPTTSPAHEALAIKPEDMANVLSYWHRRRYMRHSHVFRAGDSGTSVYRVMSGAFEVTTRNEQGKVFVLDRFEPGDFIGELGLFCAPVPRGVNLVAVEEGEVAEIGSERLAMLLAGPLSAYAGGFLYAIDAQLSRRLRATTRKTSNLALLDVRGRVEQAILDLCQASSARKEGDVCHIRLARTALARRANCSREMAGRVVRALIAEGKLEVKGLSATVHLARWSKSEAETEVELGRAMAHQEAAQGELMLG